MFRGELVCQRTTVGGGGVRAVCLDTTDDLVAALTGATDGGRE
jgi:hypothetical protein